MNSQINWEKQSENETVQKDITGGGGARQGLIKVKEPCIELERQQSEYSATREGLKQKKLMPASVSTTEFLYRGGCQEEWGWGLIYLPCQSARI